MTINDRGAVNASYYLQEMSTLAMEKTLFNMKLTSKQLQRESKKSEKKQKEEVRWGGAVGMGRGALLFGRRLYFEMVELLTNAVGQTPVQEKKVLFAIKKGDKEIMNIHASNAIREKNQAINFLRLSSRIEAVSAR